MFRGNVDSFWFSRGPCQGLNIVGGPWGPATLGGNSPVMTGKLGRETHKK